MAKYFLNILLLILTCSFLGHVTEDIYQTPSADKATLVDVDLFGKNEAKDDVDPLDVITPSQQSRLYLKFLAEQCTFEPSCLDNDTPSTLNIRAPPYLIIT